MRDTGIYLVQNHMRAGELVKCKSKYSAWLLVSDPLFYRMRRIAVADSAGTLGDDGKSICDWEEEFSKSLAGTLVDKPMPKPIVTFPDLCGLVHPYFLDDALGLAYKLQINGDTDNRSSIVKCVVNTYKKKKIP
jgi:hypothetical protein